jgi:hypothetical protein
MLPESEALACAGDGDGVPTGFIDMSLMYCWMTLLKRPGVTLV